MMNAARILLAEDDKNLAFVIEDHLIREGFEVVHAPDGEAAWSCLTNQHFDLCIIDVMMPKMDGFTLADYIRSGDEFIPILFLTAKSMEEDRLRGFAIGGDDYISKPFSITELIYRIRVFLRRNVEKPKGREPIALGMLTFDADNLQIRGKQKQVQLTQMEAELLRLLLQERNKLVKREEILIKVWGENDYFKGRSLDVFISRLRKYLSEDPRLEIRNHHGVGFTLVDNELAG